MNSFTSFRLWIVNRATRIEKAKMKVITWVQSSRLCVFVCMWELWETIDIWFDCCSSRHSDAQKQHNNGFKWGGPIVCVCKCVYSALWFSVYFCINVQAFVWRCFCVPLCFADALWMCVWILSFTVARVFVCVRWMPSRIKTTFTLNMFKADNSNRFWSVCLFKLERSCLNCGWTKCEFQSSTKRSVTVLYKSLLF